MKKNRAGNEWFKEKEASTSTRPYRLTFWCLTHFPRWLMNGLIYLVSFYFFIFDKRCRHESIRYQKTLKAFNPSIKGATPFSQVVAFAVNIVEKIDCWTNPISLKNIHNNGDVQVLVDHLNQGKGAFVIVSHLGNSELLRSLANKNEIGVAKPIPITVLSDRDVSSNFSKAMTQISKHFYLNTINVNDITPATIERIQETISQGGLVVCAGDRLSKNKKERVLRHSFLGKEAPFSYGAYYLVDLVAAPVYFIWGFRKNSLTLSRDYEMTVVKAKSSVGGSRAGREKRMNDLLDEYVKKLEEFVQLYPCQWYNFFDFWMFPNSEANGEKK